MAIKFLPSNWFSVICPQQKLICSLSYTSGLRKRAQFLIMKRTYILQTLQTKDYIVTCLHGKQQWTEIRKLTKNCTYSCNVGCQCKCHHNFHCSHFAKSLLLMQKNTAHQGFKSMSKIQVHNYSLHPALTSYYFLLGSHHYDLSFGVQLLDCCFMLVHHFWTLV